MSHASMLESDEYKIVCNPEFLYLPITFQASGVFSTIDIDFNLMKLFSFESRRKDVQEGGKHTTTILWVQKKHTHNTRVC